MKRRFSTSVDNDASVWYLGKWSGHWCSWSTCGDVKDGKMRPFNGVENLSRKGSRSTRTIVQDSDDVMPKLPEISKRRCRGQRERRHKQDPLGFLRRANVLPITRKRTRTLHAMRSTRQRSCSNFQGNWQTCSSGKENSGCFFEAGSRTRPRSAARCRHVVLLQQSTAAAAILVHFDTLRRLLS